MIGLPFASTILLPSMSVACLFLRALKLAKLVVFAASTSNCSSPLSALCLAFCFSLSRQALLVALAIVNRCCSPASTFVVFWITLIRWSLPGPEVFGSSLLAALARPVLKTAEETGPKVALALLLKVADGDRTRDQAAPAGRNGDPPTLAALAMRASLICLSSPSHASHDWLLFRAGVAS